MKKKYRALRTLASLFEIVGAVLLVISGLAVGALFGTGRTLADSLAALGRFGGFLLAGFGLSLLWFAAGQLIRVVLDIEENTRRAAENALKSSAKPVSALPASQT